MTKNCSAAERTRGNLIQAFWSCYEKAPLGDLAVKYITQTAGYNRSTFYVYFDDMDDLLEQAEEELLERLKRISDETIATGFSEASLEKGLGRWVDECGKDLRTVLGPWGDLRFLEKFKNLLYFPEGLGRMDAQSARLLCEFTSAVFISASAYLSARPDTDRT